MRSVKKLFYTTLALTLTGLIMRTVGVWFNVYLTGLIGTSGIGIFQLILSVYAMAKTLAYAGMNLGATRLCIDDFPTARHSMRLVLLCAFLMGAFSNALLYYSSDFLSVAWMHAPDAARPLRALSFSLPFVSLSAGINGYMTAARKMSRYSVIQLLEQLCRIGATVLFVAVFGNTNQEGTLFLVALGITVSEIFSFSLCLFTYFHDVSKYHMTPQGKPGILRRFARIAVPDAVGAYVRSALNTIEHLLIPWGIRRSGISTEASFSAYGIIQGMALPVLLYPSAILGVVSSLLVPEIAECKAKRNAREISYMISRVVRITVRFSIAVAVAVSVYARPLSQAVFHTEDAALYIRFLAPLIPVMYLDMASDGMLKGLDKQLSLMKINVLDSVLCVALVYFLVPRTAVNGYIITIYTAEIINFLLSFRKLCKETLVNLKPIRTVFMPGVLSLASFICAKPFLAITKDPTPGLVFACGIGSVLYLIMLRVTGCVSKEDASWAKKLLTPLPSSDSQSEASRFRPSFVSVLGSEAERKRRTAR